MDSKLQTNHKSNSEDNGENDLCLPFGNIFTVTIISIWEKCPLSTVMIFIHMIIHFHTSFTKCYYHLIFKKKLIFNKNKVSSLSMLVLYMSGLNLLHLLQDFFSIVFKGQNKVLMSVFVLLAF